MDKRNRQRERKFGRILEENSGKTVIIRYETRASTKEREVVPKLIVGKIGEFERDFTNSTYGNSVYLGTISEDEKFRILSKTNLTEREERKIILGAEKGDNYREKYYTRRISELEFI